MPRDRLFYQALADQAAPIVQTKTDTSRSFSHRLAAPDSSSMFMPTRVCWDALQKALAKHSQSKTADYILKIDVAICFGSLNQHTLITATLSAAVDLVSGFVHHVVTERHRSREFIAFLERLDAHYPAGMLICLLLDNHAAHCSRETKRFLASKPGRFELVFTPTHASWLNYVETFFSKLARSALRRIRVASKAELADRIGRYIRMRNAAPLLPRWRYGITPEPQALAA